jgi:hypothetical protein
MEQHMKKQLLGAAGILAAGLIAGSALSLNAAANAADTTSTPSSSSSSSTPAPAAPKFDGTKPDIFSATPVRADEKAVAADVAAILTSAAEAKEPGATVIRVETDGDGAAYEVHMKKADGSVVTVKFDANYNITSTEDGFGPGPKGAHGPDGHGFGGHGDNDGDGPQGGFKLPSTGSTPGTNGSTNG